MNHSELILLDGKKIIFKTTEISKKTVNKPRIKIYLFIAIIIIFIMIYSITLDELRKLTFFNISKNKLDKISYNYKSDKDAVLLMTPHHGNLGDQAITLAELKFLKEIFTNLTLVYNLENYTNFIHNDTIIFLQGGGNLGWTYYFEEKNRREVIKSYPNNNIIILPQTIYFEKTDGHQQEISSEIYCNHSKLIIITREKISFNIANNIFQKNKIILSPDIVTYLDDLINLNNITKKGVLFLLRKDREKFLDKDIEKLFIEEIKNTYNKYEILDNNYDIYINSINQSKLKVSKQLKKIAQHELVITDRLHGMIFSAITKTSCIAIKNYK